MSGAFAIVRLLFSPWRVAWCCVAARNSDEPGWPEQARYEHARWPVDLGAAFGGLWGDGEATRW